MIIKQVSLKTRDYILVILFLFCALPAFAQDSVTASQDSSMTTAQDQNPADTSATAASTPELSLGEQISSNKVLLYSIAGIAFVLIITLTWMSSIRKSKGGKTGNIGYRKPGGHHQHHHRHK
ncbi:MAG: hypothetical protein AB1458_06160 [Bacteroidota bacterium]